jgi:hypothetical protein
MSNPPLFTPDTYQFTASMGSIFNNSILLSKGILEDRVRIIYPEYEKDRKS